MPNDVTVADIYEKAAEVLETEGWIQGNFHDDGEFGTGYCAVGGIKRAGVLLGICPVPNHYEVWRHDPEVLHRAVSGLEEYLNSDNDGEETCITEWNDEMVESAAEVIDTFKHLAKDIRNELQPGR